MPARAIAFVLLSLVAGAVQAQVNALPPERHILVFGEAQARAIPDRFKIALEFEAVDADADAARRRVEANVADVLAKLKQAGVPEGEIVATSLQIGSRERYDEKRGEDVFVGTEVSRRITARFPSQAALEEFLGRIRTSKELKVSNVTTELADEPALRKALRQKAIESSRQKAETIAAAYGARLGGLYSVSDVAPQFQYGIREGSWPSSGYEWVVAEDIGGSLDRIQVTGSRAAAAPSTSFQTGYVNFNDKIYAVFLLAD